MYVGLFFFFVFRCKFKGYQSVIKEIKCEVLEVCSLFGLFERQGWGRELFDLFFKYYKFILMNGFKNNFGGKILSMLFFECYLKY